MKRKKEIEKEKGAKRIINNRQEIKVAMMPTITIRNGAIV